MIEAANSRERGENLHVQVPTPGDHYSPATGSAIMTIIYELARRHALRGGETEVIVGRGTRHDYPVGRCTEVDFPPLLTRRRKAIDAGLGRLGLRRPLTGALYRPAIAAVHPRFEGPLFVHNAPASLPFFARSRPHALLSLYVNNVLFRTYGRREARRTVAAAGRIVCVSEFIARELAGRLGSRPDSIVVVNNGVDVERFRPAPEPDHDRPVVLFLGRVVPEKGPDLILRAAQKLAGRGRRFVVRIVGSSGFSATDPLTPYERELRALAEPIADAVQFVPFVDRARVVDEYGAASIFCVPSNWDDPCPLTVGEALASGLPTIAARRGGIPEVAGDAALYFRPPDADELAERLAYLIDEPSARSELRTRARARAEEFSWERQYVRLLEALSLPDGERRS